MYSVIKLGAAGKNARGNLAPIVSHHTKPQQKVFSHEHRLNL